MSTIFTIFPQITNLSMIHTALLKAVGLCLISVIIEAISATKEGKRWFESLKRPKFSFSFRIWYVVGALYYLIFGYIAYRLFLLKIPVLSTPIILLILVMIINGLSNFIVFKYRSIKWFYLIIYPFAIILLALIAVLSTVDLPCAILASVYFLWLFYDLYYGYNMWKLNDRAEKQ